MTPETSNGTANDDQRCYIERLERIEQVARAFLEAEATAWWGINEKMMERSHVKALRAALEANR